MEKNKPEQIPIERGGLDSGFQAVEIKQREKDTGVAKAGLPLTG